MGQEIAYEYRSIGYRIMVNSMYYLVAYDRIGDTHWTFSLTSDLTLATIFDFKTVAIKALYAYAKTNSNINNCEIVPI